MPFDLKEKLIYLKIVAEVDLHVAQREVFIHEIDLSDVKFVNMYTTGSGYIGTHAVGILDIAGPAPQNLPIGHGLPVVIARKDAVKNGHVANLDTTAYVYDLSDLSADEVSRAQAGMCTWIVYSTDGYPANPAVNEIIYGDVNFARIPSVKEIEQGVRNGKTLGEIESEHNNHASVSPKKMKEKKDADLMRAILNGKDKEYS